MPSKRGPKLKNDYDLESHTSHIVKMHRYLWEQANGPIPEGMVIHHVDGDNRNNDLTNLVLVTPQEHSRIHQGWARGTDGRWLKPCPSCGLMKDAERDFYWRSRGRPVVRCKPCQSQHAKDAKKETSR